MQEQVAQEAQEAKDHRHLVWNLVLHHLRELLLRARHLREPFRRVRQLKEPLLRAHHPKAHHHRLKVDQVAQAVLHGQKDSWK